MPHVNVIVSAFNEEENIRECIKSILEQTHEDFNLTVVDDGSTDSTGKIIKSFKDDRIKYIKNEQRKGYTARNKAIDPDSRYTFFIDADCHAHKKWIEKGLKKFSKNVAIVGGITYKKYDKKGIHSSYELDGPGFSGCNVAYRTDILTRLGGFNDRYKDGSEDSDLFIRASEHGKPEKSDEMIAYHMNKKKDMMSIKILLRRVKTLVYLLKDHEHFLEGKKHILFPEHVSWLNRVYVKTGKLWMIRPYYLFTMFFPPLIFLYVLKNRIPLKFIVPFYAYIVLMRLIIWKTAVQERILVI